MRYYIIDQSGKKQALLQNVTSVQWNPKYWESGSAEIHARPTDENVKYLKEYNRVVCADRNEILFIDYVQRSDDNEYGDDMIVHGKLDNLGDRVNTSTVGVTDVEEGLRKLLSNNVRSLDIHLAPARSLGVKVARTETTWATLREDFEDFCQATGLGWREVVLNGQLNTIDIYKGSVKKGARFSDDLGNIISQQFTKNLEEYGNYLYIAGEDQGSTRKRIILDKRLSGEPTKEVYIDARDLQSTYTDDTGADHTYSNAEYEAILKARGEAKYAEMLSKAYQFECQLDEQNKVAVLGRDYDLGDLVPIQSHRFGVQNLARITGLKFVEEENTQTQVSLELTIETQEVLK